MSKESGVRSGTHVLVCVEHFKRNPQGGDMRRCTGRRPGRVGDGRGDNNMGNSERRLSQAPLQ